MSGDSLAGVWLMRFLLVLLLLGAVACRTNETPESQVNDAEILASVKAKLAEGLGAATVTNISVNVTNGVVTLSGTAHNADEKSKAISIAQAVPKVVSVNDSLQIAPAPPG
jgi:osmotically-inducible protein OsmY